MLKSKPPTSIQPVKGSRTQRFQKYAFQECFYKKETTTFLHCKCHKLLIFNTTLKQVTEPLKINHWCWRITAEMSIEWGRLSSPGEDGEVMAEDINPKSQLLCEEVLQSLCSSHRKKTVCPHWCTWLEELTSLIGVKCVYTQDWIIPTINSRQNLPSQRLWIIWGSSSFLEFTGN